MIKKLILAALLLPLSPLVLAGDINPGGDNPGSTTTTLTYLIVDAGTGMDSCLETADWCGVQVAAPLSVPIPGKKGKKAMLTDAQATAFASVACTAAANAESEYAWFFEGGGELNLTRHGNHGAMHHIQLNADLAAGTLTFAAASICLWL